MSKAFNCKPFQKILDRKPLQKRLERKLFQKKFDQKRMLYLNRLNRSVINRRNGFNASLFKKGLSENPQATA
ncbi:hypothetical protein EQO05_02105 [Methanosarcina sp. MSH10X1]|uniref:hypothetical protein n=1 Tax=Methanosarcina sp. MSH10X1 TaxID=2507075 RepID=UPI000FFBD0F1|nr:hypothetical protein [Methanosarcina sp. MSH10X1]RXA21249.1 hypothetical protein EQO05_02105 [Methanosarcina sp. MSH10X1]